VSSLGRQERLSRYVPIHSYDQLSFFFLHVLFHTSSSASLQIQRPLLSSRDRPPTLIHKPTRNHQRTPLEEAMPFVFANPMSSLDQEDQVYEADVNAVKKWWTDSRWRYTKRPFTAEQIVAKRGNLEIVYPSNAQSKKLWNIIEGRFQVSHCGSGMYRTR